jgi:hypothetical protein
MAMDERYSGRIEAYNQKLLGSNVWLALDSKGRSCSNCLSTISHFKHRLAPHFNFAPSLLLPAHSATTLPHHARHRHILILVRSETAPSFQYYRRSSKVVLIDEIFISAKLTFTFLRRFSHCVFDLIPTTCALLYCHLLQLFKNFIRLP